MSHNFFHHLKGLDLREDIFDLQVLGIGEASTFPGFCGQHDQIIFAPIEKEKVVRERPDQAILFFLKTVCHEYASKREASYFFHEFRKAIGDLAPPEWHEFFCAWERGVNLYLLRESPFYVKRVFDVITSRSFDQLRTIWVTVDQVLPISTCTAICPWLDEYEAKWTIEKPQPIVSFTISPSDGVTHVIISWLVEHDHDAAWIVKKIDSPDGVEFLVNLCVAESSDCCFNIDFWHDMPDATRSVVLNNMRHNSFRGPLTQLPRIVKIA